MSGLSRSFKQGHLILSIILNNAQRPTKVANLCLANFQDAESMSTGGRVAKVKLAANEIIFTEQKSGSYD